MFLGTALMLSVVGCKHSDVSINLAKSVVQFGIPQQLQPPGRIAFAASSDGKYLVCAQAPEGKTWLVTTWEGKTVREFSAESNNLGPVLFSPDDQSLLGFQGTEAVKLEIATGTVTKLGQLPNAGGGQGFWNAAHTIYVASNGILTWSGRFIGATDGVKPEGFDVTGNLWLLVGSDQWVLSADGKYIKSSTVPPKLARNDSDRGPLHLERREIDSEFGKGHAYITALWMTHDKAVPLTDEDRQQYGGFYYRSALVGAYPDLMAYGFVPGHDVVYVVNDQGTTFIPFKEIPKASPQPE